MRYSILALVLFTGIASATPPFAVQRVYVQPVQVRSYYVEPVVQHVQQVQDYGCVQQFAAQQFYAAPVQFQSYGHVQAVQQFGHVQRAQVQRVGVQRSLGLNLNIGGGVSVRQGLFSQRVIVRPQVQRIVIR